MFYFIVNPASRSGRGKQIWEQEVCPYLCKKKIAYEVHFSQKAGDVAKLAKQITEPFILNLENPKEDDGFCHLVVLGGDGTVNECIQGIDSFDRVLLGYIPTGSSNDLARDVGISKKPLDALTHILSAKPDSDFVKLMDKGVVTTSSGKFFFSVSCGLGFDAAVCEESMHSKLKDTLNHLKLGKLTYLGIAIKQLFTSKKVVADLYFDDNKPIHLKKIFFAAIMNHRYEGGGFKFCPTADYTDGIFELCVVGNLPKIVVLLCLPTAFFGKHYLVPGINHHRARNIKIVTSEPLWLHTDGEVHERTNSLEISCLPQNIRFIT